MSCQVKIPLKRKDGLNSLIPMHDKKGQYFLFQSTKRAPRALQTRVGAFWQPGDMKRRVALCLNLHAPSL